MYKFIIISIVVALSNISAASAQENRNWFEKIDVGLGISGSTIHMNNDPGVLLGGRIYLNYEIASPLAAGVGFSIMGDANGGIIGDRGKEPLKVSTTKTVFAQLLLYRPQKSHTGIILELHHGEAETLSTNSQSDMGGVSEILAGLYFPVFSFMPGAMVDWENEDVYFIFQFNLCVAGPRGVLDWEDNQNQ